MTLCLMVRDWRVSRAEPMLSCWHDLLFLFCLLLFYLLPSMGWLCGVRVFGLIVFLLSPGLAQRTPNKNNKITKLFLRSFDRHSAETVTLSELMPNINKFCNKILHFFQKLSRMWLLNCLSFCDKCLESH